MNERFKNVRPQSDGTLIPHFKRSSVRCYKQDLKNEKGDVISSRNVKVPFVELIPASEFENAEMQCEMFTYDNLKKAGYDLYKQSPILSPQYKPDIDLAGAVSDYVESINPSDLIEKESK